VGLGNARMGSSGRNEAGFPRRPRHRRAKACSTGPSVGLSAPDCPPAGPNAENREPTK
jgi:hypothetical protein